MGFAVESPFRNFSNGLLVERKDLCLEGRFGNPQAVQLEAQLGAHMSRHGRRGLGRETSGRHEKQLAFGKRS